MNHTVQLPAAIRTSVAVIPQRGAGLTLEWGDFPAYTKDGGEPAYKGVLLWRGGPTFFINGRPLVGARPLAEFQTVISSTDFSNNDPLHNPVFPACKLSVSCPTLYAEAGIWMNLVV